MRRFSSRAMVRAVFATLAALLAAPAGEAHVSARHHDGDRDGGGGRVQRAALPTGAIDHIVVIDLENESESTTFGPGSPATYLNNVLLKQGVFVKNYWATGHASLDNYIAQVSGQAPTEETSADCLTPATNTTTLIGSYVDLLPGTLDPNQAKYPGQVDRHGCIYPAAVPTIASQLDRQDPPSRFSHRAAWRQYSEDMGNQCVRPAAVRPGCVQPQVVVRTGPHKERSEARTGTSVACSGCQTIPIRSAASYSAASMSAPIRRPAASRAMSGRARRSCC